MGSLSGAASLKKTDVSSHSRHDQYFLRQRSNFMSPLPIHAGILTGLILYMSCPATVSSCSANTASLYIWLFYSFHPLFWDISEHYREGMWYRCVIYSWEITIFFSALWPFVGLCIDCYLLQKEVSLMKVKRWANLCMEVKNLVCSLLLYSLNKLLCYLARNRFWPS